MKSGLIYLAIVSTTIFVAAISTMQRSGVGKEYPPIDVSGFFDSAHHWYDIRDETHVIYPLKDQKRYSPADVKEIADNILLFQKDNGGWPKNYDMLAVLSKMQKKKLAASRHDKNTTFDNGATHSQVEYLAAAYTETQDERYKSACLRGIDFVLSAQYPNGGWPQFFPDTIGYAKEITFNDDAMIGVLEMLQHVIAGEKKYVFIDHAQKSRIKEAFRKGLDCILKCQIKEGGKLTAWCQQHDNVTLKPVWARTFEPPSVCSFESADMVMMLMKVDNPDENIRRSIQAAVKWIYDSRIFGIRVDSVPAPEAVYQYHSTGFDVLVVKDTSAPAIWTRFYELGTNRPLFCDRHRKIVYTLAEVSRERRTGYRYYGFIPDEVIAAYPEWQKRWAPGESVLEHR